MEPRPSLLAVLVLLAVPPPARADAIGPPPENCAPGAIPISSHGGEWCEDTTCQADADCERYAHMIYPPAPGRFECVERSVCVPPGSAPTGPRHVEDPRGGTTVAGRPVTGSCSRLRRCSGGALCDTAKRCVLRGAARRWLRPGSGGRSERGGCSAPGSPSSAPAGLALLALGLVLAGRLRRRGQMDANRNPGRRDARS